MHFLATEISNNIYVNIMDQYFPCGDIIPSRMLPSRVLRYRYPAGSPLARRITRKEFMEAIQIARDEGLSRIDREL